METKERIAKVIARAGLCSRREAERWIADGRVSVNGQVLDSPAVTVDDRDAIHVDGKPLPQAEKTRLFRYHKPAGLVTTAKDEQGRTTVFDSLPSGLPRLISVGRLDLQTEGLLLLTNDGALARHLELPSTGLVRRYRVRVQGAVDEAALAALKDGVTVEGVRYGSVEAVIEKRGKTNLWLTVSLSEGKNREIRRIMTHLGLRVSRLIRTAYGPFVLWDLGKGEVSEVSASEISAFSV